MNAERDHVIATQHRAIAALHRDSAEGNLSHHAANARKVADCHDRIAELHDPPDPSAETETPEPAELGELLDAFGKAGVLYDRANATWAYSIETPLAAFTEEAYDKAGKYIETTRKAIIDFVARQGTEENERLRGERERLYEWLAAYIDPRERFAESPVETAIRLLDLWRPAVVKCKTLEQDLATSCEINEQWEAENEQLRTKADAAGKLASDVNRLTCENHKLREAAKAKTGEDAPVPDAGEREPNRADAQELASVSGPDLPWLFRQRRDDTIVVAFPIGDIGRISPASFLWDGRVFLRSSMVTIPKEYASSVSCCREYVAEPEPPQTPPDAPSEPERKPGDVFCDRTGKTTTPDSEACQPVLAKWRTAPPGRGLAAMTRLCRQCDDIRTEPGEPEGGTIVDACDEAMRDMGFTEVTKPNDVTPAEDETCEQTQPDPPATNEPPEMLPELSEKMQSLVEAAVQQGVSHQWKGTTTRALTEAIRDLEANQRPEPVDLGTDLEAAVAALPLTLRAIGTDAVLALEAAGEAALAVTLLRSVAAEVIDPEATCGECRIMPPKTGMALPLCDTGQKWTDVDRPACMKIKRKAKPEPEVKARFFLAAGNYLWVFPDSTSKGTAFGLGGDYIDTAVSTLENIDKKNEITYTEALVELADWPQGVAKLRELVDKKRK